VLLKHRERGQTLPLWSLGIALALLIAFGALQYGEYLRWQIRAQNAADAAAAGALSVQTQAWNEQMSLLYAAGVEEYRIHAILEALILAANNDSKCQGFSGGCFSAFQQLNPAFKDAVQRYTTDVALMNRVSSYTFTEAETDARAIVADFQQNCGKINGGDCSFAYTVSDVRPRAGTLNDVEMSGNVWAVNDGIAASQKLDYTPAQIEVVTCASVPPIVPSFLGFQPPTFKAIGRAAATAAMVTQEWLDPGVIVNPTTGKPFQPPELPVNNVAGTPDSDGKDWFTINFAGNPATAYVNADAYTVKLQSDEYTAVTGWWATIPIKPYSGQLSDSQYACK